MHGIDLPVELLSDDLLLLLWFRLGQQLYDVSGGRGLHITSSRCGCHPTWDGGNLCSRWSRLVADSLIKLHL